MMTVHNVHDQTHRPESARTMKAAVVDRYGTPDVLEIREVARPAPGPGEVLVRVHAASINDWDWGRLSGDFPNRLINGFFKPRVEVIGCDIAGQVEAAGEDVTAFRPGDRVYGDLSSSGFGAFAQFACAPEHALAPMAEGMSYEQAAAIPQAGMLAVQGLIDTGQIRSGQKLLLNGAGGGVGTIALQLCRLHDVEVTAVDKPGKLQMLREMGADHVMDCRECDFTRTGERYDLILDVKTDRSPFAYARALRPGGVYATVGGSTRRVLQTFVLGPLISWTRQRHLRVIGLKANKDLVYLNELFEQGKFVPVIDSRFEFKELAAALRRFGTGDYRGKIIVTMA